MRRVKETVNWSPHSGAGVVLAAIFFSDALTSLEDFMGGFTEGFNRSVDDLIQFIDLKCTGCVALNNMTSHILKNKHTIYNIK